MKITHDDLKRAYKSHIRRRVPPSREACPPAESIFSVFDESVPSEEKEKVFDHITSCCYCLQEFELFLDFHRKEEKAVGDISAYMRRKSNGSETPGRKASGWGFFLSPGVKIRPLWRIVAASLCVVSFIVLSFVGIKSLLRTAEDRERGRLPGQIHLISPVRGEKAKTPLVFQWGGTPRVEYYQLEIFDSTLLPLWKSPCIPGPPYELPPEATDILKKNKVYFWTIKAWLIDGTSRESTLEEFVAEE